MLGSIRLLGELPSHGIIKVLKNVNFNLGGDFFVFTKKKNYYYYYTVKHTLHCS